MRLKNIIVSWRQRKNHLLPISEIDTWDKDKDEDFNKRNFQLYPPKLLLF